MKTIFQAGRFVQDPFGFGLGRGFGLQNGGRGGGPAYGFSDEDRPYRYCDPATENCPIPLVSPVLSGSGPQGQQLACGDECECECHRESELGCKKCADGKRRRRRRQAEIPDTSNAPISQWNLQGRFPVVNL